MLPPTLLALLLAAAAATATSAHAIPRPVRPISPVANYINNHKSQQSRLTPTPPDGICRPSTFSPLPSSSTTKATTTTTTTRTKALAEDCDALLYQLSTLPLGGEWGGGHTGGAFQLVRRQTCAVRIDGDGRERFNARDVMDILEGTLRRWPGTDADEEAGRTGARGVMGCGEGTVTWEISD
ncbi:Uu.00g112500.m01.CDS01 [Anthostomella pinea]|uniref:Uu.00g112500.m01.CDS01 n=1 Tax=Anthostomella pinea TaxID=933095 RepID=A0AAI8YGG9_9PEZI|nr:Uu.00g112500.m01.CDS01 [Anthostomella pinea]